MEIIEKLNELQVFDEFKAQLQQLKIDNEKAVFVYESPSGNKAARSHIYKLRQTKSAIEKTRKYAKEGVIEYGRKIDKFANDLKFEIEKMIAVHEKPLLEIEQKERDRVAAIKSKVDEIYYYTEGWSDKTLSSIELRRHLNDVKNIGIDDSFQEFKDEAINAKEKAIADIEKQITQALEKEELDRLREEERKRKEEETIQIRIKEAEQKAIEEERRKAEQKEREAIEREKQHQLAIERAREEKELAEKRALEAERLAKEKAERENQEKFERELIDARKREADKIHAENIHNDIFNDLIAINDLTECQVKYIIKMIAGNHVRHVKIIY